MGLLKRCLHLELLVEAETVLAHVPETVTAVALPVGVGVVEIQYQEQVGRLPPGAVEGWGAGEEVAIAVAAVAEPLAA